MTSRWQIWGQNAASLCMCLTVLPGSLLSGDQGSGRNLRFMNSQEGLVKV